MATAALDGMRVLIAEDSWPIALSLKATLERAGAQVVGPVPTVARACRLLDEEDIGLALVDVSLRDGMAHPLIEALTARGVKTVVLSGYPDVAGLDRDKVVLLAKPVEPEQLIEALRSAAESAG